MINILYSKEFVTMKKNELQNRVNSIKEKIGYAPSLTVIQIGNDEASNVYIRNKEKIGKEIGINVNHLKYNTNLDPKELSKKINELNNDNKINGIIIQLPVPDKFMKCLEEITPEKDVDGFGSLNISRQFISKTNEENYIKEKYSYMPCTAEGVIDLLKYQKIDLIGKHVVIVGRSNIVGKPLAIGLLKENCTVTICHSKTENLKEICKSSDILITAIGKAKFITREYIGNNTNTIIDVGISRLENGKLSGDCDFNDIINYWESLNSKENSIIKNITPVPGGVGPLTVIKLMEHTVFNSEVLMG